MTVMVTAVEVRRSRQVYEGVYDIDTPGGTLAITAADCAAGPLQNFLRWPPTDVGLYNTLRVSLTKISPAGGALGTPTTTFVAVGTRIDVAFDDPGLGVTERWQVRIEDPFSPTR